MDADVAVIGVGTMGAMSLWQLARRGVSAIGFEQFGTPHDRSAHGAESRIFRTAYMEGAEYVPLLQAALRQWRELEAESDRELLTLNGGLTIGSPDAQFVRDVLNTIREFDLPHELLDETAAAQRFPQHRLLPGEIMVIDKQAGFLRPEFAVAAAVDRAEQLGATVRRHSTVEAVEPDTDGVRVRADGEWFHFRTVIITVGAWAGTFLPEYKDEIAAHRLVSTWFSAHDPSMYRPDKFPIFIRESAGMEHSISGFPSMDGGGVKVILDKFFGDYDADHLDRNIDYQELDMISQIVRDLMPGLNPNPIRVGVYMDGYTRDHHAIVGLRPDAPSVVVMVGFSGHGFKMSPIMGQIAADLAIDGATDHSIAHLSPMRMGLTASAK